MMNSNESMQILLDYVAGDQVGARNILMSVSAAGLASGGMRIARRADMDRAVGAAFPVLLGFERGQHVLEGPACAAADHV